MAGSNYSKVDEYGFERPKDFDFKTYDAFMSQYVKVLTRRALRWNNMFGNQRNINFRKNATLKRFVRKGIPTEFRTRCWMTVSGAERIKNSSNLTYQQLKSRSVSSTDEMMDAIKIDLPRTFPDNIFFSGREPLPNMLYNVLATFAHQNSEVGYCQGLSYVAGLILLVTKDEAASFWLLKTLIEQLLPKYYVRTMSGLITDLDVLNELVRKYEPLVQRHIQNIGMPWAMGTTKWFICLYADVLPTETVLRIWDSLFFEGSKILFRVALTLIRLHKAAILQTSDLSELTGVFRNMKNHPRVIDCHSFMKDVFELSGNLSNSTLEKLRITYKKE
ncbi:hypothetical protein ABEB36_008587 [Hypothenemus hampei]|uniref:Growth hormone-regulated TBC protein 1 n=1 Tax=Hypothenemus hampei TaxID=57062 RepID=A0ABD1EMZ7_HYPHA